MILRFGVAILSLATALTPGFSRAADGTARRVLPLDKEWRFSLGDPRGAESPQFDDSAWGALDVPHDWSIDGPFDEANPTGGAGAFLPAGIGWYRKTLTLPDEFAQRRVFLEFDGVMAHSEVWINGFSLGRRPNGYIGFRYDLTGHLQATNRIAVRVDNSAQPASRWYAGAGIYRHVRLIVTDPVHLDQWGTFVSTPQVSPERAAVRVRSTVVNQSGVPTTIRLRWEIIGQASGSAKFESEPQTIDAGTSADFQNEFSVDRPRLWDLEHPNLYRLSAEVRSAGRTLDNENVAFGIREARFDSATGFWLNGRNLKLKGVCLHHDAGALGAAVPLIAWQRRLDLLKQAGCNAIRTAHNPFAPEFLDLCDRLGFLVMDEMFDCWTAGKNRFDYHLDFNAWSKIDTRDTVRRDRNHPSMIVYSAGNEIRDTPRAEPAKETLSGLLEVFHHHDPTRPVSQALFRPNASHDYENGLADLLDVIGQNYRENELLAAHEARPARKILGTENAHDRAVWLALRDHPAYSGQFLWTGFDYLGESRRWPLVGAAAGLFDRTGAPRPRAFERASWWSDRPMVRIVRRLDRERPTPGDPGFVPLVRGPQTASDWTPANPEPHEESVEVYSNCERVELLLNGKSLGSQTLPADASSRSWKVPFVPGLIEAVGRNKNAVVARHDLRTAGKAVKILLAGDRSTLSPAWDDIAYLTATIVDEQGIQVPSATNLVTFRISGPGAIVAVDNGDNSSHEPFHSNARHAWQGRCIAITRATAPSGRIVVEASAPGLVPSTTTLKAATETALNPAPAE